jgi:hypothetical protein
MSEPPRIEYDEASWRAGVMAGRRGDPLPAGRAPPGISDPLAWISGYIEGKAMRERGQNPRPLNGD